MAEIRKYVVAFTNYHIHYAKLYLYTFIEIASTLDVTCKLLYYSN